MFRLDLPRFTALFMVAVGTYCVWSIMQGHLSDAQTDSAKIIAIACYGFATGGKFLNLVGSGIKAKAEEK